jgi:hypothetical protein
MKPRNRGTVSLRVLALVGKHEKLIRCDVGNLLSPITVSTNTQTCAQPNGPSLEISPMNRHAAPQALRQTAAMELGIDAVGRGRTRSHSRARSRSFSRTHVELDDEETKEEEAVPWKDGRASLEQHLVRRNGGRGRVVIFFAPDRRDRATLRAIRPAKSVTLPA